jgi:nucleotide-binding universal stress UspA family protein
MNATADRPAMVAGIDGSDAARQAAVWAGEQAARRDVELRLVYAVTMPAFPFAAGYVPPPDFVAGLESEGLGLLEQARAEVRDRSPRLAISMRVRTGHPVGVLVDESRRARLLVVASREQAGARELFAGSTAVGVAAHAHCPTAVIPARGHQSRPPTTTGPVVVGVDGSPASEAAVAIAFEEASARRAELIAVHAWTEFASDTEYLYARQFIVNWEPFEAPEKEILTERLAGWQEKYPDVKIQRVLTLEKPARALLDYGATAQLIVVGSRGRGGFTGMLLGSVSQTLIHHAECPLIIARP